jgi:LacI family transcriptional regulator
MTTPVHRPGKPATIYDVAREAGVSHQTVALYLRGHQGFRPATRERVETALRTLNYRPNLTAKSLATARSHRIGALSYALADAGPNLTIQGASQRARAAGYVLDIVSLDPEDPAAIENALGVLGQQSLAGLLAFAPIDLIAAQLEHIPFSVPFLAETHPHTTPVEWADDPAGGINGPGLNLLVDHLVALGHRRFIHISGPPSWAAAREREVAYLAALDRHGLVSLGSIPAEWTAEAGYSAAMRVDLALGATAIVAASDQIALGAMLALTERGVRIPEDVSVTGFDGLSEAPFYRPPLTTVHIDYPQQGRMLVDRLLARIDPAALPDALETSTPQLRIRRSSAPPPEALLH